MQNFVMVNDLVPLSGMGRKALMTFLQALATMIANETLAPGGIGTRTPCWLGGNAIDRMQHPRFFHNLAEGLRYQKVPLPCCSAAFSLKKKEVTSPAIYAI